MIILALICGVVFYVFGALVVLRICEAHWHGECRDYDHFECGGRLGALLMGIFWPVAPPLYLLGIALWRLSVVVSDNFKPKKVDR